MFTGFDSENTPGIKVWDFSNPIPGGSAKNSVSLTNDCAPIQFFKTGGNADSSSLWISVYLPSAPIEGKVITVVNARYGSGTQSLRLKSSDVAGSGTGGEFDAGVLTVGSGQSQTIFYSKDLISYGPGGSGVLRSGWASFNVSPSTAANAGAVALGNTSSAAGIGAVSLGYSSSATGSYSGAFGGDNTVASGQRAMCIGTGTASGSYAGCISSKNSTSNGDSAVIVGGSFGFGRSITGLFVAPASDDPFTGGNSGNNQSTILILARQTTDATPTVLRSNSGSAGTTNQLILQDSAAYYFKGSIVGRVTSNGSASAWSFEGLIRRSTGAATTVIVQSSLNLVGQDAGASSWAVAISADTTNGGLAVTCTGQAATTIKWVAKLESTELRA